MRSLLLFLTTFGAVSGYSTHIAGLPPMSSFPEYRVYPGAVDEDGFPVSSARLCTVESNRQCFTLSPQTNGPEKDEWTYFGLRATSRRIKLQDGGSLVLFNANCGGGSGSADRYVLLRSGADRHLKNLLPAIILSNQAEIVAWDLPTVSSMPVLATADFIWGGSEAHYSPHLFDIRIYVYDSVADKYQLRKRYQTLHKYPGIDNWDSAPEVLENERNRILQKLGIQ